MNTQNNDENLQEFHFGEWTTSSDNDSQEIYDSDTICPISLNDLINIRQKTNKDEDTEFIVPSLADAFYNKSSNKENELTNQENHFSTSVSKILYDFSQNATVLGFDSSFSDQYLNEEQNKAKNTNEDTHQKLNSFTSLIKNEQTFVKLHEKYFSSSSSSDILIVTNEEVILEPDSDSSTYTAFEEFNQSKITKAKSQIYDIEEKEKSKKSIANSPQISKSESQIQNNLIIKKNEKTSPSKQTAQIPTENSISKSSNKQTAQIPTESSISKNSNKPSQKLNDSIITSSKRNINKPLALSGQKRVSLVFSSSSSSVDFDNDEETINKGQNLKGKPPNQKRHLNTISGFDDDSYSSSSSDFEIKKPLRSEFEDSLNSTVEPKEKVKQSSSQILQLKRLRPAGPKKQQNLNAIKIQKPNDAF